MIPWPWPDIPGPKDWLDAFADMVFDFHVKVLNFAIDLIMSTAPPPLAIVESDWFGYLLGSWLGFGLSLLTLMIVLVHLILLVRLGDDRRRTYPKMLTSVLGMILFVRLYFPAYALLYKLSRGLSHAISDKLAGEGDQSIADQIESSVSLIGGFGKLFGSGLALLILVFVAVAAVGLVISLLGFSLLYPVLLVLRPVSKGFNRAWHLANAALATVFLAPPLMVFWVGLTVWVINHSEDNFPESSGTLGMATELLALILCVATPAVIMWLSYNWSTEVIGKVDTAFDNALDFRSSDVLSVKEAEDRVSSNHGASIKEAAVAGVVASIDDKPGEPMSVRVLDMASTAAMATGHPVVAGASEVAKVKFRDRPTTSTEGGDVA